MWSDRSQRGNIESNEGGLINQSLSGGDLEGELEDAKQGRDANTTEIYHPR